MSIHGFGRNFLHEAAMRKAAAEGKRVLCVTPDGWFMVDADGTKTPVDPPAYKSVTVDWVDEDAIVTELTPEESSPIYPPAQESKDESALDRFMHGRLPVTSLPPGRNWFYEKFVKEGETPVDTPEGKEVTIYILLFRDDGYPQHTHYISPHGSLGEAKAAVRKTRFTAKVWKANSEKEWHLTDSAHEGTWIIRESHVRINGEG